ncbi:cation diffusion facilitator family transporter [Ligilactobacillus araffinosus]|uniref:Cation diffusion facilitator family transporter n=1 Tax=Ligilactobacillus araffinosus DSM 20653 TaxID=1423820 RepID=A0A0R1ZR12_9LACO|nr:cation diffusion facilitator family transporter [Ligilactobacillus araffinosus]KRM52940.1 cation diffusion facilitator family transporter [Ligilactobacillus araffinosus DSM 20653]
MVKKDNSYEENESMTWEKLQSEQFKNYRLVKRSLVFNVLTYVLIFLIEYGLAIQSGAEVLKADAFNNLSGIISTFLLIVGIHIASDEDETRLIGFPVSDQNELSNRKRVRLSRFRFETIFTLVTSILMIGIVGAGISVILILLIYIINYSSGKKTNSTALLASAQDSLGDILTSVGTAASIFAMWKFGIRWIDSIASIVIGCFILYSGFKIFLESSLNLADYFNPRKEEKYKKMILNNPQIKSVPGLTAHYNGSLVTVEAEVIVSGKMIVKESFILAEQIEETLKQECGVSDTKIIFYPNEI